jgi:hypothetical protein
MSSAVTSIVSLIAIGMAEAVRGVRRQMERCLVGGMIAVVFVALVTLMPLMGISFFWRRRSQMHLLHRAVQCHLCRHGIAGPAAQGQQDHHENEHQKTHTHTSNDKGRQPVDQAEATASDFVVARAFAARRSKTNVSKASNANGTPTQASWTKPSVSSKAPLIMLPSAVPM